MKRLLIFVLMALVLNGTAQAWWNDKWTLRKKITIDLSNTGGAISDQVGTVPVLIRLSDFNFGAARDDGSDIRVVTEDDKTVLSSQLEHYDSVLGEALLWVSVPNPKANAATTLYLYYGNQGDTAAPGDTHTKPVFDADSMLVYHFGEKAGTPPADSSANAITAQNAGIGDDGALIGTGLRLDGKTSVIIPAAGPFAWADGSSLTWSAWVKPAALTPNAIIFSRRDGANAFLVGMDNGVPFVEINGNRSQAGTPVTANTWHHIAVVVDGQRTAIYLDGAQYSALGAGISTLNSVAYIGGEAPDAKSANAGFAGEFDELEISKVVRTPAYIKFLASEESGDAGNKTIAVGQDEAPPAGWFSGAFGLFGVILKSVTIDGWVVIGILAIMSVISWYVMITKFFYVNRVQKCNELFLKQWETICADLTAIDHSDTRSIGEDETARRRRMILSAPLYRIYHIGSEEIGKRVALGRVLSSRSIQAVRASLDGGFVRENHALNDGLVFLTISIAGGPFMGLLGTVVGVMITFAAIAATGEVNISAIAPGLAAALVATVAGLLVAIPALLGYNYLTARLKTVTADLQIFIDEFVTKMAEFYSPETEKQPMHPEVSYVHES